MSEHTPTPWKIREYNEHFPNERFINISNGYIEIGGCSSSGRDANAQFIVKACNAHESLLNACKEARDNLGGEDGDMTIKEMQLFDILYDAIEQARED